MLSLVLASAEGSAEDFCVSVIFLFCVGLGQIGGRGSFSEAVATAQSPWNSCQQVSLAPETFPACGPKDRLVIMHSGPSMIRIFSKDGFHASLVPPSEDCDLHCASGCCCRHHETLPWARPFHPDGGQPVPALDFCFLHCRSSAQFVGGKIQVWTAHKSFSL